MCEQTLCRTHERQKSVDSRLGGDGPGPRGRVALTVGESLLLPASSRRFSRVPIRTPDFHRLLASRPCSVVKVALAFRRAYEYAVLHHASPPRGDCGPGSIEEVRRHCNTQSMRSPSVQMVSAATSRGGPAVEGCRPCRFEGVNGVEIGRGRSAAAATESEGRSTRSPHPPAAGVTAG